MNLYHVSDIDWDIDDYVSKEARAEAAEALNLPPEVWVYTDDPDNIADLLSDRFGWCINSSLYTEAAEGTILL